MLSILPTVLFLIGVVLGAVAVWLLLGKRLREAERQQGVLQRSLVEETGRRSSAEALSQRIPVLEDELRVRDERVRAAEQATHAARVELSRVGEQLLRERENAAEKVALLDAAKKSLEDSFKALSSDALSRNNEMFLELARAALGQHQERAQGDLTARSKEIEALVKPIRESLDKVDGRIHELENARVGAYAQLTEQVRQLHGAQQQLQLQTQNLVQALRAPATRGRWGEIQLKRVVEMAGMIQYCDFTQQDVLVSADGRLRPDMLVRLPNEKLIVVDAKVPLEAYLDAREAPDEASRSQHLLRHAQQIRAHIRKLSEKSYWEQFQSSSPEFVVLFLPGEPFYSAALEADAELIESAVQQRVLIATPMTLIALLKAVSFGWRQETITREAQQISEAGSEVYKRVRAFAEHFEHMKRGLDRAVGAYNKAVGSLERSVLPATRKMRALGAGQGDDIATLDYIDHQTRSLSSGLGDDETAPSSPRVVQTEL